MQIQRNTLKITTTAMFTALGIIFPTFFHAIGFGTKLAMSFSPMHIPVFLCGLICGPISGIICGILTPLLSSLIMQMPPIFPVGVLMMFELATYGAVSGLLIWFFNKKWGLSIYNIIGSLFFAMIAGRIVYGVLGVLVYLGDSTDFTFKFYINAVLLSAWPGIILHIILIPTIIFLLYRFKILSEYGIRYNAKEKNQDNAQ